MPRITLRDIARYCGVDRSTVSRALRDDPLVNPATRLRVLDAADLLNYRPNITARSLAGGRSEALGFVAGSLAAPIDWRLVVHATQRSTERAYNLFVTLYDSDDALYRRAVDRLGQGLADGAIVLPRRSQSDVEVLRDAALRGFPMVFIDNWVEELPAPVVTTDNRSAAQELVRRCLDAGAEEMVLAFPALPNPVEMERLAGAEDVARQAGVRRIQTVGPDDAIDGGASQGPIGIVGSSQGLLHSLMSRSAAQLRLRRMTIGCFDAWLGEPHPADTVIVALQDIEGLARVAVDRALALVAGEAIEGPRIVRLPALEFRTIHPSF